MACTATAPAWQLRPGPGGQEPEFRLGPDGDPFIPLSDFVAFLDPAHRDLARDFFAGLLLRSDARSQAVLLRAAYGPLAGALLRFETVPGDMISGEVVDFLSQLTPMRRALGFLNYDQMGTWVLDRASGRLDVDAAWAAMLGHSPLELADFTHADWVARSDPQDVALFVGPEIQARLAAGEVVGFVSRTRHRLGHWVWLQTSCRGAVWTADGQLAQVVGYDIDISDHRRLQAEAEGQRDLMRAILDQLPTGQLVVDRQGRITFCNTEAAEMIGQPPDRLSGQVLLEVLHVDEGAEALRAALASPANHRDLALVVRGPLEGGHEAAIRDHLSGASPPDPTRSLRHLTVSVGHPPGSAQVHVGLTDMTARHRARLELEQAVEQARFIATHDLMTGLPDRYYFLRRLSEALETAETRGKSVAVMMIDLDNFKQVNDGLGHEMGDQLLKAAAARLVRGLPDRARLARFGGDEFVLLVPNCSPTEAALLAHELQDRFHAPIVFGTRQALVSCSIGIGLYPQDATTAEGLVRCADLAMYEAKSLGRGHVHRFTPDLRQRTDRRAAVLGAVQRALDEDGFRIVLQPKFDLAQLSRPIGAEVLLRLTDPDLMQISPGEFIPIAEAQGLIPAIDREVLRLIEALQADWLAAGVSLPLSMNLSAVTLQAPGIGDLIENLPRLAQIGGGLMVEVTETSFIGRLDSVRDTLHILRQGGVGIAIDDFGIGHSSLSYLQSLPIQELKIDRTFVAGLDGRAETPSNAIVRAILAMAEALGLRTVAEGVETIEQAEWLMDHGCHRAQGYLLGHPTDPEDFRRIYLGPQREQGNRNQSTPTGVTVPWDG